MATNYLKWINISLSLFIAFAISFLCFSGSAFADTSNVTNYRCVDSADTVSPNQNGIFVSMPDGSEVTWTVQTDAGSNFTQNYFLIFYRPDVVDTFLGDLTLDINSIVSVYPYIHLILPIADFDEFGNLYYTNTFEYVTVIAGQPYFNSNEDENNFDDDYYLFNNYNTRAFSGGGTQAINYRSGNPETSYIGFYFSFGNYVAPNGLIFTGSYGDVWTDNPYNYMCYIFQTLKYMNANRMRADYRISKIYADGFAHLDTEEYKLYKETLENAINSGLTDTNEKLDDLLNEGSGQFDDIQQEMDDASDRAETGNQDIADNAPKPDINDTVNDTSDVIDDALSGESFDKISGLLSAIFTNTLISTILLISVAVGAVKYIFFGKG